MTMPWEKQPVQQKPPTDYNELPDFLKRNEDGTLVNPSGNPQDSDPVALQLWGPTILSHS